MIKKKSTSSQISVAKLSDRPRAQLSGGGDCLKMSSKVNAVENKSNLIGEMRMQASGILSVWCIRDTGQSHISRMIEYNVRCGACDQHVRANIKLTTVQQKRVQHISEVNEKDCFSTLGFLSSRLGIIRKITGTWPDPINVWGFAIPGQSNRETGL